MAFESKFSEWPPESYVLNEEEVKYFSLLHQALSVLVGKLETQGYKNENCSLVDDPSFLQLKMMSERLYNAAKD